MTDCIESKYKETLREVLEEQFTTYTPPRTTYSIPKDYKPLFNFETMTGRDKDIEVADDPRLIYGRNFNPDYVERHEEETMMDKSANLLINIVTAICESIDRRIENKRKK